MSKSATLDVKEGMLATFDNPKGPYVRWGMIRKIEKDMVLVDKIGWGSKRKIQAVQQLIDELE
ncbi:hypothetical protein [Tepidanaerobacter acetatoxydans]|uniref:hypothetical protein n=1 Tax=Tepidanaerobacter acetatoxydans TaxID=499229 RepID=UPI001BD4A1FB|nr:hypothetical protein [Tepidanaerobacter acetatoxydans]